MFQRGLCGLLTLGLITFVIGCGCEDGREGDERDAAVVADPVPVEVKGIGNTRSTGDLLFRGQPSEEAIRRLAKDGYETIVSTRGTGELEWDEQAAVEAAGMSFVLIAMDKPVVEITDEQIAAFDEVIGTAKRPMFLHCSTGNRTAGL